MDGKTRGWVGLRLPAAAVQVALEEGLRSQDDSVVVALLRHHEVSAQALALVPRSSSSSAVNLALAAARGRSKDPQVLEELAAELAGMRTSSVVRWVARPELLQRQVLRALWEHPRPDLAALRVGLLRLGTFSDEDLPELWREDVLANLDVRCARDTIVRVASGNPGRALALAGPDLESSLLRDITLVAGVGSAVEALALERIRELLTAGNRVEVLELVGVLTRALRRDRAPLGTPAFDMALEVLALVRATNLEGTVKAHLLDPEDRPSTTWVREQVAHGRWTPYAVTVANRLGPQDSLWAGTRGWLTPAQACERLMRDKELPTAAVIAGKDEGWVVELVQTWQSLQAREPLRSNRQGVTRRAALAPERWEQVYGDLADHLEPAARLAVGRGLVEAGATANRAFGSLASKYPDLLAALTVADLTKGYWWAHQALIDLLEGAFGEDVAHWEAFVQLSAEWEGTVGELLEAVQAL